MHRQCYEKQGKVIRRLSLPVNLVHFMAKNGLQSMNLRLKLDCNPC